MRIDIYVYEYRLLFTKIHFIRVKPTYMKDKK